MKEFELEMSQAIYKLLEDQTMCNNNTTHPLHVWVIPTNWTERYPSCSPRHVNSFELKFGVLEKKLSRFDHRNSNDLSTSSYQKA